MPWLTKDTDGNFQSLTFWVMIWVSLSNIEYILNTVLTVILTVIYMTQSFVPLMYYNSMHDTEVRTLRKKSLKKHNGGISGILIDHLDEKNIVSSIVTVSFTPQIWMPRAASTRLLKCIGWNLVLTSSLMRERRPSSSLKREEGMARAVLPVHTVTVGLFL